MIQSLTRRSFAALAVVAAMFAGATVLQPSAADAKKFTTIIYQPSGGVAIHGYDPVAYFTIGKPTKGSAAHSLKWKGATWHFSSAKHLAMFKGNPEKYAPQFGGYCAYGLAVGGVVPTKPDVWAVHKGKLYFNVHKKVQGWWDKDRDGFIKKAWAKKPVVFKDLK